MSIQSFGPFCLDASKRLLEMDGAPVIIGGRTLDLLIALVERAGDIVSVRELMARVWPNVTVEEANLRVSVSTLRKALGDGKDGARYIINVPGRGYSFVAPIGSLDDAGPIGEDGASGASSRSRPLPEAPRFLVGRHDTVEALSRLLMTERFVSVIGPGGIGKTTVALAVAGGLQSHFDEDRLCFVDCEAISDPEDFPRAVAAALACPFQEADPLPGLCAWLSARRTLLVLDSCEHIIEAAAALCECLSQSARTVHLLVTSREALRVEGEHVHLLAPLHCPIEEAPSALQAMRPGAGECSMAFSWRLRRTR